MSTNNNSHNSRKEPTFGDGGDRTIQETEQVGTVEATTTSSHATTKSGKGRIVFGIVGIVALGLLIILASHFRNQNGTNSQSNLANTPNVQNIPGTSTDAKYNKIQSEVNEKASKEANSHNGGYVPVPVGNSEDSTKDPYDSLYNQKPNEAKTLPQPQPNPVMVPQPQPQQTYAQPANLQQNQQLEQDAEKQLGNFIDAWSYDKDKSYTEYDTTGKAQQSVGNEVSQTTSSVNQFGQSAAPKLASFTPNNSNGTSNSSNGNNSAGGNGTGGNGDKSKTDDTASTTGNKSESNNDKGATFVHAGVIVPVDIVTPANTDYPGPVRAVITDGPLKGSIVLATPRRENDKMVIEAGTISIPNQPHSFSIKAIMTDAADAAPYLATSVNRHLFKRYTLLTLSALASGYGEAVSRENSTVTTSPFGGTSVSYGNVDNKQIVGQAIGQVGTTLSSDLLNQAQQPPTVRLDGKKGEPFHFPAGLLFLSDF
jgi:hypothetical protein